MTSHPIRPARSTDATAVAAIWEQGWSDGHLGNVPEELVAARSPESFRAAAAGHSQAWLKVVPGNTRARRFYQRCGWIDDGPFDISVPHDGRQIRVPCRRYTKAV